MTVKISDLDPISSLGGTALVEVSDNGASWSATIAQIREGVTSTSVAIPIIIQGPGVGSAIETGEKGAVLVPFDCELQSYVALADQVGSIVVDVWLDTFANWPVTDADSITGAAPIQISSADKAQDATLPGWSKSIPAGSILRFNVDSVDTIERCSITLTATKTVVP